MTTVVAIATMIVGDDAAMATLVTIMTMWWTCEVACGDARWLYGCIVD